MDIAIIATNQVIYVLSTSGYGTGKRLVESKSAVATSLVYMVLSLSMIAPGVSGTSAMSLS